MGFFLRGEKGLISSYEVPGKGSVNQLGREMLGEARSYSLPCFKRKNEKATCKGIKQLCLAKKEVTSFLPSSQPFGNMFPCVFKRILVSKHMVEFMPEMEAFSWVLENDANDWSSKDDEGQKHHIIYNESQSINWLRKLEIPWSSRVEKKKRCTEQLNFVVWGILAFTHQMQTHWLLYLWF